MNYLGEETFFVIRQLGTSSSSGLRDEVSWKRKEINDLCEREEINVAGLRDVFQRKKRWFEWKWGEYQNNKQGKSSRWK